MAPDGLEGVAVAKNESDAPPVTTVGDADMEGEGESEDCLVATADGSVPVDVTLGEREKDKDTVGLMEARDERLSRAVGRVAVFDCEGEGVPVLHTEPLPEREGDGVPVPEREGALEADVDLDSPTVTTVQLDDCDGEGDAVASFVATPVGKVPVLVALGEREPETDPEGDTETRGE